MGVFRAIMAWLHLVVGKVAATTAGHQNCFTHFIAGLQHQHPATPLACRSRAHEPRGAAAYDDTIEYFRHRAPLWSNIDVGLSGRFRRSIHQSTALADHLQAAPVEIGRASCRERGSVPVVSQ